MLLGDTTDPTTTTPHTSRVLKLIPASLLAHHTHSQNSPPLAGIKKDTRITFEHTPIKQRPSNHAGIKSNTHTDSANPHRNYSRYTTRVLKKIPVSHWVCTLYSHDLLTLTGIKINTHITSMLTSTLPHLSTHHITGIKNNTHIITGTHQPSTRYPPTFTGIKNNTHAIWGHTNIYKARLHYTGIKNNTHANMKCPKSLDRKTLGSSLREFSA